MKAAANPANDPTTILFSFTVSTIFSQALIC